MTNSTIQTSSESWRLQCEACHVLSLPFDRRIPYLNLVGRKRGIEAQQYLEQEVRRQFAKRRKAA